MGDGIVYLVGAGPGDPGLITVKGLQVLREADAVVFDRLANPRLLAEARTDADLIDAGKGREDHRMSQDEINAELVRLGVDGKKVCRLKGGDPFVFGRGGEEALALHEAGVRWEVVPGVTSAVAAPAYAGIPVTHRGKSAAFTVITGSEDPGKPDSLIDWDALARMPGTLVFLMGWKSMPTIIEALVERGMPSDRPAALVQWGTLPRQRAVVGTASDIVEKGTDAGIGAPVALVLGEVAELRASLAWFDSKPLFGKRVLVTRARSQASRLASQLEELGAETVELPAIEIALVNEPGPLDDALRQIDTYDWITFTSSNAVRGLAGRMAAVGIDSRALAGVNIAAVGTSTAAAVRESLSINPDLVPDRFLAEEVAAEFKKRGINPTKVLHPRSDIGRESLPNALREMGAEVDEVAAYSTVKPDTSAEEARAAYAAGIDYTTFTSSSGVKNLLELFDGDPGSINSSRVACIGPITADSCRDSGIRIDVTADEQTINGLVNAVLADAGTAKANL